MDARRNLHGRMTELAWMHNRICMDAQQNLHGRTTEFAWTHTFNFWGNIFLYIFFMKVIVRKWNLCVFIIPPSDYVLQVEVYKKRRYSQALGGSTFLEGLKPFFIYNFHRCVGNNHENRPWANFQVCGGVCGVCGGRVGSGSDGLGRHEDATTNITI